MKTRLAAEVGADGAARLYAAFVRDLCERLAASFSLTLAVDPAPDAPLFSDLARRTGARLLPQGSGDLGARMAAALETCLRAGEAPCLLVGTDLPSLPVRHLEAAAALLDRHALVLGPSADGGYWAVGAARTTLARWPKVAERLFSGIPWGGSTVLRDTLARAGDLDVALGPAWYDVDTPRDLVPLVRHLSSGAEPTLPHTRAVLAAWGRL